MVVFRLRSSRRTRRLVGNRGARTPLGSQSRLSLRNRTLLETQTVPGNPTSRIIQTGGTARGRQSSDSTPITISGPVILSPRSVRASRSICSTVDSGPEVILARKTGPAGCQRSTPEIDTSNTGVQEPEVSPESEHRARGPGGSVPSVRPANSARRGGWARRAPRSRPRRRLGSRTC